MTRSDNIVLALSPIDEDLKLAFTVDCVIFGYDNDDLKVLTIECNMDPFMGMISLLGDFITQDEDADSAAKRILKYCTGNEDIFLEEVKSFSKPDRHPFGRVITIAFYSLVPISLTKLTDSADKHLKWVSVDEITEMAFDHKEILDNCLYQLRKSLREKPIGFELLPKKFSLKQLQTLYEVVLGIELDKRNFRRKLRSLNILIDLEERQQEVSHRPAKLYKFDEHSFEKKSSDGLKFEI
ncbi:NUDIX hydrolase [Portibacter lacus]|uniref:DNA mismatch repair protein MutT n=1 Tax=Portibacter lacus TaxID=1099794 RepID=A0AA37WD63_9BACT|nr:NUDIX domain-containing protein [Portibacter lacus]GLR15552.1 DNA mismatch repair protein MutT [Portibacter lacus]